MVNKDYILCQTTQMLECYWWNTFWNTSEQKFIMENYVYSGTIQAQIFQHCNTYSVDWILNFSSAILLKMINIHGHSNQAATLIEQSDYTFTHLSLYR